MPLASDWHLAGILAILGFSTALWWASPALAQRNTPGDRDVFTISDVEVDATAANATEAQNRAIAEGQKAALGRLFTRIVLAADSNKLPQINAGTITELVRDFEVTRERRSSVRYLAVIRVRFKPDRIRNLLRGHDIGFAETRSMPILVLPVFEVAGAFSLWGEPNPWRDAWQAAPPSDGLVPLVHPTRDIRNAALIGAEQAVRGDNDRLAAIARKYSAANVLVAVVGYRTGTVGEKGQAAQPFLQITLNRMGKALTEQTHLESFALGVGESHEAAIGRAVAVISDQIQEEWKRDNRLRFGVGKELSVTVPLTSLADWLYIKRRLAGIAQIRGSNLLYLSRKQALLRINYIGDEDQLTLALVHNSIILERSPVSWILRRSPKGLNGVNPSLVPSQFLDGGKKTGAAEDGPPIPQFGSTP